MITSICPPGSVIADVAEWQTRSAQDAVGAIPWRFKSSHPHQYSSKSLQSFPHELKSELQMKLMKSGKRAALLGIAAACIIGLGLITVVPGSAARRHKLRKGIDSV